MEYLEKNNNSKNQIETQKWSKKNINSVGSLVFLKFWKVCKIFVFHFMKK